jgi:hypothetical protein
MNVIRFASRRLALAGILCVCLPAAAQISGHYDVHVTADNSLGGDNSNIVSALAGLHCTSSDEIRYKETHRDYRGQDQEVTEAHHSTWGSTLLRNPDLNMQFDADMSANSHTQIVVTESCYFDPTVINALGRILGKLGNQALGTSGHSGHHHKHSGGVSVPQAHDDYATMTWECDLDRPLPRDVGAPVSTDCRSTNVSFPFTFEQALINYVRDKRIRATFTLQNKKEKFAKNFCGENLRDRLILHLGGGVGGHSTEHAFVFHVVIENTRTGDKHDFDIATNDPSNDSGTLNDDIAYCGSEGKRDPIRVTVTARTDHSLFPNRNYFGRDGSESVTFYPGQGGDQSQDVRLYRNTAWGHRTERYNSDVEVTVIDPTAGASRSGEPSLASSDPARHN